MGRPVSPEEHWRRLLMGEIPHARWERRLYTALPRDPRCKVCHVPFAGAGGLIMRAVGYRQLPKNPRFCNRCMLFAGRHRSGAEVELTFLFADVRGSTALAERMTAAEFSRLMNRFYEAATRLLVRADAWIDKLLGDEVVAFFLPFMTRQHARAGVEAAVELLRATGHGDPGGPWIPVGAGVHTGVAYVGVVGTEETVTDVTALGDAVNITARLASAAGPGEILVSDAAAAAAGLPAGDSERRRLELRGRQEPVAVRVLHVAARASARAG